MRGLIELCLFFMLSATIVECFVKRRRFTLKRRIEIDRQPKSGAITDRPVYGSIAAA